MSTSASQSQAGEPTTLSWEGDKMFNIYIYDYCSKRGFRQTAQHLMTEAEIPPDAKPPINARQGLLFEWWSVFWVLFTAKASGSGSEEALLYTHHQAQQSSQRQRILPPPGTAPAAQPSQAAGPSHHMPRTMNGVPPNQQQQPPNQPPQQQNHQNRGFPNGSLPNGIPSMGGPQVNGITGPPPPNSAPPTQHPGQPQNFPPQMNPRLSMGGNMPHRGVTSPPMEGAPGGPQTPQQGGQPMAMGQSPHMGQMNRGAMMPPSGAFPGQPGMNAQGGFAAPPPLGRPPSRAQTPNQGGMMTQPSPGMAHRQPPQMGGMQMQNFDELKLIPPQTLHNLRQELGLEAKDLNSFTPDEKSRLLNVWRSRRTQRPGAPNAVAGPSNGHMPPPPLAAQGQRRPGKRSSTSPPDTTPGAGTSPPDRKRVRRSPIQQQPGINTPVAYPPMGSQHHPPQQGQGQPGQMPGGPMPMPPHLGNNPGMRPNMGGPPMQNGLQPGMMGGVPTMANMNPQMGGMGLTREGYRQSIIQSQSQRMPGLHPSPNMPGGHPGNAGSPPGPPGSDPSMGGAPHPFPGAPGPAVRGGQPQPPPGLQQPSQQQPKMMPPPPSPNTANKDAKDGIKVESSPMGLPPGSTPNPNHNPSQTPTPVPPSPSTAMPPQPDMFTTDFMGMNMATVEDLDLSFMQGGGDINFERDFGQWFNPDDMGGSALDIGGENR